MRGGWYSQEILRARGGPELLKGEAAAEARRGLLSGAPTPTPRLRNLLSLSRPSVHAPWVHRPGHLPANIPSIPCCMPGTMGLEMNKTQTLSPLRTAGPGSGSQQWRGAETGERGGWGRQSRDSHRVPREWPSTDLPPRPTTPAESLKQKGPHAVSMTERQDIRRSQTWVGILALPLTSCGTLGWSPKLSGPVSSV